MYPPLVPTPPPEITVPTGSGLLDRNALVLVASCLVVGFIIVSVYRALPKWLLAFFVVCGLAAVGVIEVRL